MHIDPAAAWAALVGLTDAAGSGGYTTDRRLYHVTGGGTLPQMLVEAWCSRSGLNQVDEWQIHLLAADAGLALQGLLGQRLDLHTRLVDGSVRVQSGVITAAGALDGDGAFARYRVDMQAWPGLLAHTVRSQAWAEKTLVEIVESLFEPYRSHAAWRWADCVAAHLARSPFGAVRSWTVQYRESDLAFLQRLLAEEGLVYRFEPDDAAPMGHRLVVLADTPNAASCPEDPSSASPLGGRGLRFHRVGLDEPQDTLQTFGGLRRMHSAVNTLLATDYKTKLSIASSLPTLGAVGGAQAPWLESYDHAGPRAFVDAQGAQRATELGLQALEAHEKVWLGHGTVRTLQPGTWFELSESPLDALQALADVDRRFLVTTLVQAGINNLPREAGASVAAVPGAVPPQSRQDLLAPWVDAALRRQAAASGYANQFQATRAAVPWRARLLDDQGVRLNPRPTAPGALQAVVVGADGGTTSAAAGLGSDEIHMDVLGRVRVRFDFQTQPGMGPDTAAASTWVRVMQHHAGSSMGLQFIPRIGQEVLVLFEGGDIDRPVIVAALYDGRGEGGVPPSPGGRDQDGDASVFDRSTDHRPSAQGNLSAGRSPAWHAASAGDTAQDDGGQANPGALGGIKTQEYGGLGFNQLVFDDSPQQLRLQWASTQHATQINLGHLIHQADNHRGSFRGLGFELRSDAYGAVRARGGVLLSTHGQANPKPAGDVGSAVRLSERLKQLAETLDRYTAPGHQDTVGLAAHRGSVKAGASFIAEKASPLAAAHDVLATAVADTTPDAADADASARQTAGKGRVPHSGAPVVHLDGQAGLALTAGADLQAVAAETATFSTGRHADWASGGDLRLHTGQAIGILGGTLHTEHGPAHGATGTGLEFVTTQRDTEIQAQSDRFELGAKKHTLIESTEGHIDIASPKKISLSTTGGANITIEGGGIVVQCPGTITVLSARRSFLAPSGVSYPMPPLPGAGKFVRQFVLRRAADHQPLARQKYRVTLEDGRVIEGVSNDAGETELAESDVMQNAQIELLYD